MEKPDPVLGDLQCFNLPHASNLFTFVGGPFNSIGKYLHRQSTSHFNPGEVYAGKTSLSPELTLVEFISTSAAFHGVTSQLLASLEEELLKVILCP